MDEQKEIIEYELIANDDVGRLTNGRVLKVIHNITFIVVEFILYGILNTVNFYVDTTDNNIKIEKVSEDLIIICENKCGFAWGEFYKNINLNYLIYRWIIW